MINACLAAAITAGACHALPGDFHPPAPPPLPGWATQQWVYDAAGIVAGETVHDCVECDLWTDGDDLRRDAWRRLEVL